MNATIARSGDLSALLGRMLIAAVFVPAGIGKLAGFAGVAGYIASKGVPLPALCAAVAIAIELGAGTALLLGWNARLAALALAIFVAVITPIFHGFWGLPEPERMVQFNAFFKNVGIVGGLLVLAGLGAGRFALDGRRGRA